MDPSKPVLDEEPLDAVATSINHIPFVATLDPPGHLARLVLDLTLPSAGQLAPIEIDYSEYGSVTPDAAPGAAEVIAAPADFYDLLSS